MKEFPVPARVLIWAVAGAGAGILGWALAAMQWGWLPVVGVAVAMGVDFLRVDTKTYSRTHRASMTLDIAAVFFMLRFFGLPWAVLSLVASTMVFGATRRIALHKLLYNIGTLAISAMVANQVIRIAWPTEYVAIIAGTTAYYAVNTLLIAAILAMVSRRPLVPLWRESYSWIALQQIAVATAGFVLGDLVVQNGWRALLVALPLPMLHYTYALYTRATRAHTVQLQELSDELITTLAAVVDARDSYTFGHSTQVARYSVAMARQLGYAEEDMARLHRSALLHDIGKVGIPEHILFKPGRLSPEEYELMKRHSVIGYDIIKRIRALKDAAGVCLHHHERWNGTGYPDGLSGNHIDRDSRIVGVADTLDTILSDRPYRKGATLDEALTEIRRCSGTQFDPAIVEALEQVVAVKGRGFFVNSADSVQGVGANVLQWSPADSHAEVAAGKA